MMRNKEFKIITRRKSKQFSLILSLLVFVFSGSQISLASLSCSSILSTSLKSTLSVYKDAAPRIGLFLDDFILNRTQVLRLAQAYKPFDFTKNPVTLGIEVEGYTHESYKHQEMLARVAQHFSGSLGLSSSLFDGQIDYKLEGHEYSLQVVEESITGLDSPYIPAELVSPILRKPRDREIFYSSLEVLKKDFDFRDFPLSAGVHIHIGFPKPRLEEITLLTYIFSLIEDELYHFIGISEVRELWALKIKGEKGYFQRLLDADSLEQLARERKLEALGLNLFALVEHGTVEFKIFNSSTEVNYINAAADFVEKLVVALRRKDPAFLAFVLNGVEQKRLGVRDLFEVLHVDYEPLGDPKRLDP